MRPRWSGAVAGLAVLGTVWAAPSLLGQGARSSPPAPAFRIIELPSGRTLSAGREDLLRTPVLPGSIAKIATLIAALESGVIGPDTRMPCPRHVDVDGRRVACSHPDVGRPIGPAEALAHSCNGYFVTVAAAAAPRGARQCARPARPAPHVAIGVGVVLGDRPRRYPDARGPPADCVRSGDERVAADS